MEGFITTQEAAQRLGRSRRTLEMWRTDPKFRNRLKFFSDGYRVWYDPNSVRAYLEGLRQPVAGKS